ncbi:bacillithiol system redox-active protein YtxJ [Paenibacillus rhizovicinus]|uniref:Bacillithiol system redox-active protein YtxJ n=1 Tax=Paenibacillus rhizovicinus TaxID=2704463 RepID=A0A6C0P7C8_9BACL|nr:bacillithiol system redox-active protein YtxJ [Paenibacillus rhizovicinus]QHW34359.1 bacillithiol system redox-active protein YtxJ [Paenibacillus rhizovicinus]
MEMPIPLATIADWEDAFSESFSQPVLVFKHSTQCSISSGAYDELSNWLEDAKALSLKPVMVLVPENRIAAYAIAEQLQLKHESPQLIMVDGGKVSWHASHWRITYSTLDEHLGTHCEK